MAPSGTSLFVFGWSALFAAIAYFLECSLFTLRSRDSEASMRRGLRVANIAGALFWGGIAGWAVHAAAPLTVESNPEILAIFASLAGRGGIGELQRLAGNALARVSDTPFKEGDEDGSKDEDAES